MLPPRCCKPSPDRRFPPVLSTILTWILLALIPVAPVVLRLFAGDEPRSDDRDDLPADPDDTRLDEPDGDPQQDEPGGLLAAA